MKIKNKFKLFINILNLKYISVAELQSYITFNTYMQFGDLLIALMSVVAGFSLYFEAGMSATSSIIFFCFFMFVKLTIDTFLLYFFNKRIVKNRIKKIYEVCGKFENKDE